MTILTFLVLVTAMVVLAALVDLVRLIRADGYGLRRPPGRARDLAPGLPNGPYSRRPPR
jgi:hypothetical protein